MNILIYTQYFFPETNAAANRVSDLADFLAKNNEVTVLTGFPNHPLGKIIGNYKIKWLTKEKRENINILRSFLIIPWKTNSKFWRYLNYFSFAFSSFINLFKIKNLDVVFVSSPPISILILAYLYAKLKKIKLVVDLRDLWPEAAISLNFIKKDFITKQLEILVKKSYFYASKIIVNTPSFQKTLVEEYKITNDKILYLPNGFDIDGNMLIKNSLKRSSFDFKIFYAGLFGFAQNVNLILDLALVCQNNKENIQFVLVGDGPLKNELKIKIRNLNLQNVTMFDYQKKQDLFNLINECDLGLITYQINDTFRKNIPSKIFEYMFLEKPIIINLKGQASTIIEDGDFGICIETNDPQTLYNGIKENIYTLKQKGINGFLYLQKHFNKNDLFFKLQEEINKL